MVCGRRRRRPWFRIHARKESATERSGDASPTHTTTSSHDGLRFDVVVVGAGTAGLAAARAAHSAGARVAVVDHGPLGAFCARLACMPSKVLLQSTSPPARALRLRHLGVTLTTEQIVGPNADVLIHIVSYAVQFGATVDDMMEAHHYHPSLAEMFSSLAQRMIAKLDGVGSTTGAIAAVESR